MNLKEGLKILFKGSKEEGSQSAPKQKKVREKKITRLHLILAGIVFTAALVTFIVIKVKISNKDLVYRQYEKQLVDAAEIYYEINDLEIVDGEKDIVKIKELKKANLINNDLEKVENCQGYVESISEKDYDEDEYVISRKAYIKCGNKYKTINYVSVD